jgi:hypothetical protein
MLKGKRFRRIQARASRKAPANALWKLLARSLAC